MSPYVNRCLGCNSDRITRGKITSARAVPVFEPEGRRFFSFSLLCGTEFNGDAFACLDCGLVWSSTSTQELQEFIRKHCYQNPNNPVDPARTKEHP